jgi:hypothetical protein
MKIFVGNPCLICMKIKKVSQLGAPFPLAYVNLLLYYLTIHVTSQLDYIKTFTKKGIPGKQFVKLWNAFSG